MQNVEKIVETTSSHARKDSTLWFVPNHRRLCLGLLAGLLLVPACTPDEEPPRQRQHEPLWVIVDAASYTGLDTEIWAFDISDPGPPLSARRLARSHLSAEQVAGTPWGGVVIQFHDDEGWHHELLRLDEAGDPEQVSLLDHPNFELINVRFGADGRRMLAEAYGDNLEFELWAFEFDQREVVDARRLDSWGEDSEILAFDFTPAGDAALWIGLASPSAEPSPLMMAPLEPTVGPSMALTPAPVADYRIFADKLLIFDYVHDDVDQGTLLLPLADLLAQPVPGPTLPIWFSTSADGRWLCYVVDDVLSVIAFDGLSFAEPKVIDTGSVPPSESCEFSRTDTVIYQADYQADSAVMMVDLSGPEPSPALALTSSGEGRVAYYILSPDQEALIYAVDQGESRRLELVTFADPQPLTLLGSLSGSASIPVPDRFFLVDDRRILLRATAEGAEGGGLWLIELGPDSASATVTALDIDVPAGYHVDVELALTPALDHVLVQLRNDDDQRETLWRMPLDGSEAPTAISQSAGRLLFHMAFLVP